MEQIFKSELKKILSSLILNHYVGAMLNVSLVCLTLKYINKNYNLISDISKWIYFELTKNNYKETKLIQSLDRKDLEIIKLLINFNEDKDLISKYLIEYCSYNENYFDIVKLLVDNRENVSLEKTANIYDKNYFPLVNATIKGHFNIVKLLVNKSLEFFGESLFMNHLNASLIFASFYGNFEIVKLLIDNGVDIHVKNDESLISACVIGHISIVKLLIDNGVNIHARDDEALITASENDNFEIVKFLIDNGANIHARDDLALILARENRCYNIVNFLESYPN